MRISSVDIWTVVVPTIPGRVHSAAYGPAGWDMVPKHIIRVHTDDGYEGIGETGRGVPLEAVQRVAGEIVGLDPRRMVLQHLPATGSLDVVSGPHAMDRWWETAAAGPAYAGYEALEMAIIDILGKVYQQPAHWFLGGAVRDRVPADYWIGHQTPEDAAANTRLAVERGFKGMKMKCTGDEPLVARCEAIWEVAGPEFELTIDPNTRFWRLTEALDMARRQHKPVIVLKIGSTEQGQAAAASHTGALTGSDAVFDAVFRRYGVLRVRSFEELLEVGHAASLLGTQRLPTTDAVTLVAASGGFGIMMADAMVQAGMTLPPLADTTQALIREAVPTAGTNNPVDASAQMSARPDILLKMLTALQEDANGSTLVLLLALSLYNPRLRGVYLEALSKVRASHPDRLLVIISQGPPDAVAEINALGIPVFPSIPAAATGLANLVRLGQLASLRTPAAYGGPVDKVDPAVFRNEFHAKKALAAAGISVPREEVVTSADEAVRSARETGYPVVLKIASEDIAHKTEIGGVALNLQDDDAVRQAYERVMANARQHAPGARLDGVLVAPMVRGGVELIAGVSRDAVFGPVVMVGLGGIYAEILKDVAVQVAPVSEEEAVQMIRGLKMFPLLDGARGQPKADVAAAARTVSRLSEFACRHAGDVAEIDMNPILVKPDGEGALVLDALMVPTSNTSAP